jgi:hypothetical protein
MEELVVLCAGFALVLGSIWWLKGGLKAHLDEKMQELSEELAQVVLKMAESAQYAAIEPPNPMQQMLMGLIQQRMSQNRGPDGRFLPPEGEV